MDDSQRVRLESVLSSIKTEDLRLLISYGLVWDVLVDELESRSGELREVPGEVDRSEDGTLFGVSSDL